MHLLSQALAIVVCCFFAFAIQPARQPARGVELNLAARQEATLWGVSFIDLDRGWAVGQRGVILQTGDGGVSWTDQPSPTTMTLADIAMFNSQRGLAVGGTYTPHTLVSTGEVLTTSDGGKSWLSVVGHDLPRLRRVIIGPGGACVAIGDWSPVHLTSIYSSIDGGARWSPVRCAMGGNAIELTGSVDDYLVLSDDGEVIRVRTVGGAKTMFAAGSPWTVLAGRDSQLFLAGPDGCVISNDQGTTWRAVRGENPAFVAASPGGGVATMWQDRVWVTNDTSDTLTVIGDGAIEFVGQVPAGPSIRRLIRLDKDRGFAVGDFGLILATRDGGHSWRALRGGERSLALLAVAARPESIPWTILASESHQHRFRTGIVVGGKLEPIRDACNVLGPAAVFGHSDKPRRPREILARTRPAVLVLDQSLPADEQAAWVTGAIESGVKRLVQYGDGGSQVVHSSAAIPAIAMIASDLWHDATAHYLPGLIAPEKLSLNIRMDGSSTSAGLALASVVAADSRYLWNSDLAVSRRQLQVLQARTNEQRLLDSLLAASAASDFKTQVAVVQSRIAPADRERFFANLISHAAARGRIDLYVAALDSYLGSRRQGVQPTVPLEQLASLRRTAIGHSDEWKSAFGDLSSVVQRSWGTVGVATPGVQDAFAVQLTPFQSPASSSSQNAMIQLAGGQSTDAPPATSTRDSNDLRWMFEPTVLMVRAREIAAQAAQASVADFAESKATEPTATLANLHRLAVAPSSGNWAALASDTPTTQMNVAVVAPTQPRLDGQFDEPWWPSEPADLRVAHDLQFVYLAIEQATLGDTFYEPATRTRDTPFDNVCRYRLRIDVDRDLMTAYEFEFDARGNTRDSIDGFKAYNPQWFIAVVISGDRLQAEIAIRKSDLDRAPSELTRIWNLSIDKRFAGQAKPGLALSRGEDWSAIVFEE